MPVQAKLLPAALHTFLLALAIGLAYLWLMTPALEKYSLQAMALVVLIYAAVKIATRAKFWQILPTRMSIETALATFAFLLLIGSTGNLASWFFPLSYIHLFFIIFSSQIGTSIIISMLILLFHFALNPALNQHELVSLATLPIVMLFFLFARKQHQEVITDQYIITQSEQELAEVNYDANAMEKFLVEFLSPKLDQLKELSNYPGNSPTIYGQITIIKIEIEKLMQHIKKQNT